GTRLLWPFADTRFAWSVVAVVDPLPTLMLLAGVILALKAGSAPRARIAIATVVLYLGVGALQQARVRDAAEQLAASRGHIISQHEVKPTLGNLLLWRSIYLADGKFMVDAVRAGPLSSPVVYPGGGIARITPADMTPLLPAASVQAKDVARFAQLSEGYLARHPERPEIIGDVRYAMLPDSVRPIWGIVIDPAQPERHVDFVTLRGFTHDDRQRFVGMLRGVAPDTLR
ncbi:MAG: hypothetical protein Q8L40_05495, partial [Burkholderiales bacterium]|nr:hypothetical protein [Burkholderiales bacterium]